MVFVSDSYDNYLPEELVKEVEEYEKNFTRSRQKRRSKFPSNEDIVNAILEVTGGALARYNVENLYDLVLEHLRSKGFDTSMVTESRVERLVSSLIRRGALADRLSK